MPKLKEKKPSVSTLGSLSIPVFPLSLGFLHLLFPGDPGISAFCGKDLTSSPQRILTRTTPVPVSRWDNTWATKKQEVEKMVRRFHRSIYDELDELRASMDVPDIICQSVHNLNAEVAEHDDEVTVTLDTIPGSGTSKISVDLVRGNTLKITHSREDKNTDGGDGDCLREQQSFSLHHHIPLPCQVIPDGARMSLKNSILDIRLIKARP
jgi:HSP20 family molecular chaperone IbpA